MEKELIISQWKKALSHKTKKLINTLDIPTSSILKTELYKLQAQCKIICVVVASVAGTRWAPLLLN